MRIRRRPAEVVPGLTGRVRVARRVDISLDRLQAGDVVVLDALDLDRATAERLAGAHVAAVVNAAPSSSGRFPVLGARTLVESGVVLIDDVGADVMTKVRDGDLLRIDRGELWVDDERIGAGRVQSAESVDQADHAARSGLHSRVSALVADAGRRLTEERLPEVDGTEFPELRTRVEGAVVIVVAAAAQRDELREVARRLRGRRRVVVGVGAGADRAAAAGLRCDLVVVARDAKPVREVDRRSEVLALDSADLDVPVPPGVTRVHATSIGSAEDTAVLLAHSGGADLVVTCGVDESLDGLLDRSTRSGSVPMLLRLRTGASQVAGSALLALPRRGSSRPALVPTVLLCAGALAVGLVAGAGALQDTVARVVPGVEAADAAAGTATTTGAAEADALALQSALLAGRLDNQPVTVIALPGAGDPAPVIESLRSAGASVDAPVVITDTYLDPGRARVLRDLVLQLAPEALRTQLEQEPPAADPTAQTDRVLADALAAAGASSVGARSASTGTLLEGLGRMGAVTAPARPPARTELFVVLAAPAADPAAVTRTGTLVSELDERAHVVVAAPGSGAADAPSEGLVRVLRTGPGGGPAAEVATVDDVGSALGRVAAVLALVELALGEEPGDYGVARDASGTVPDVAAEGAPRVGG